GAQAGQIGITLTARYGQRLDPALANERQHRRGSRPIDVDTSAEHVGNDEGAAAVGNAGDVESVQAIEIFGDELRYRALGEAETELAGIGLGVATNSSTELAGTCALVVRSIEVRARNAIGSKSFCGSYSTCLVMIGSMTNARPSQHKL